MLSITLRFIETICQENTDRISMTPIGYEIGYRFELVFLLLEFL